jgi:hypothetical protein
VTPSAAIRIRFLQDSPSRRIGNIAANLARMASFSSDDQHSDLVRGLAEESAFFIEWAAPNAEHAVQLELLSLQRLLVRWTRSWASLWNQMDQRQTMCESAEQWAQHLLELAGLVPRTGNG